MACLAYHPSKVVYQGVPYDRLSLIKVKEDIIKDSFTNLKQKSTLLTSDTNTNTPINIGSFNVS